MSQSRIARKIRKYIEMNENKNTTYQNVHHVAKAVLIGKFIAIRASIKTEEIS